MSFSRFRVGLIGCGRIAMEAHIRAYCEMGVNVTAICDINVARLEIAAQRLPAAHRYSDFRALALSAEVDVIDLATPPHDRAQILRELVRFGKPILAQKPICYSFKEASDLFQELSSTGVPIAVNHNARWSPVNVRIKEWLDQGRLGKLYSIMHINRFNEDKRTWYTDHPDYLFLDHGLHYIDLVRWFSGLTPSKVSAMARMIPGQRALCPLQYDIRMSFEQTPLTGSLHFNNAVPAPGGYDCIWYIDGSAGTVIASLDTVTFVGSDGQRHPAETFEGGWVPDGFKGAFVVFAESILSGRQPVHSLADHLESFRVATACADSANSSSKWIEIQDRGKK